MSWWPYVLAPNMSFFDPCIQEVVCVRRSMLAEPVDSVLMDSEISGLLL